MLSRAGLGPAVTTLVERSPGYPVSVSVTGGRCDAAIESTAYFVIAEALTNIARHSAAREARVVAERLDGHLVLEVYDDGDGGADRLGGTGLPGPRGSRCRRRRTVLARQPARRGHHRTGRAPVRVILADDAVLFREALAAGVTARGREVVAQVADGVALLEAVDELKPNVAIIDIPHAPHA